MSEKLREYACQSCAFLKQEHVTVAGAERHVGSTSWDREERINKRPKHADQPGVVWCCHKGVWSKASGLIRPLEEVLLEDRKNKCFWYPWDEGTGMFFQAAEELEKRQFEFRHLRKTRRISISAVVIAIVVPVVIRMIFPF